MMAVILRYWRPLALIGLVAVLLAGYGHWRYSVADSKWQQRWTARDAADARSREQQQAAARTEEQRRQQAITRISENAQQQVTAARADAAGAADSIERLQHAIAELQRRQRSPASHPGATGTGKTGRAAADMQADLLRESLERSRALAAEADRQRIAGLTCEQSYYALIINKASQ